MRYSSFPISSSSGLAGPELKLNPINSGNTNLDPAASTRRVKVKWGQRSEPVDIVETSPIGFNGPRLVHGTGGPLSTVKQSSSAPTNPVPNIFSNTSAFDQDFDLPTVSSISSMTSCPTFSDFLDEKPPERIVASYTDDFNILQVDESILKKFSYDRKKVVHDLENRLLIEKRKLNSLQTVVERKSTLLAIERLTTSIDRINKNRDEDEYRERTADLLEMYRSLGVKPKVISFRQKDEQSILDREAQNDDEFRHRVISNYLEIARKYIKLDIMREIPYNHYCPGCGCDMREIVIDEETGIQQCSCGLTKYNILRNVINPDTARVPTSKTGYDDRENFIKSLQRDQGQQPNKIPEILFDVLDGYFESFNLPSAEEIINQPLTPKGTRGSSTKQLMIKVLQETGNSGYYEDINLICHLYWNWTLPDYSEIIDIVIEDYDKLQPIFVALPKERKSNLNIEFRRFKHLQLRGYPCDIDDFKMIKTREILEEHDRIWRMMIERAQELYPDDGFKFIPTI